MIVISDDEDINEGGNDQSIVKGENRKKEKGNSHLCTEMEKSTKPEDDICVIQEVTRIKKKKNGIVIGSFHSHERNPLLRKRVKPDLCVFKSTMKKTFPTFSQFRFKRRLFQLEQSIRPDERLNYMKLLETTMKVLTSELLRQSILPPSPQVVVRCRNTQANRIDNVPVVDLTKDSDSDTIDVEQESNSDDIQELPRDSLDSEVVEIPDDLVVAESSQKHLFENIQKHPASPLSSDSDNNCEEVIDLVDEDKKVLKASKPSVCEENGSSLEVQMLQDMNLFDHVPEVIDVSEDDVKRTECAEIERGTNEDYDYDEEDEKELPKLTDEMEVLVYSAFRSKSNDVLSEEFNLVIRTKDIHTLRGGRWLNDEIINFYMCLLMERGELLNYPSVYCFNTFFYTKLAESGHSSLKRWTRKVDIFSYDLIIVPVHLKVHWCLLCINFPEKQIEYYDSMGGKNDQCYRILMDYLKDEHEDKKKKPFNCSRWGFIIKKDIPEQLNGSDCGVFLCTYAEYICRLAKFTFSQRDMPYFRVKMAYEILTKRLLL